MKKRRFHAYSPRLCGAAYLWLTRRLRRVLSSTSGHFVQRYVSHALDGLWFDISPVAGYFRGTAGSWPSRGGTPAALRRLALYGLPRLCYSPTGGGGIGLTVGRMCGKLGMKKAACIKGLQTRNKGRQYKAFACSFFAGCFPHGKSGTAKTECENKWLFPVFCAMI